MVSFIMKNDDTAQSMKINDAVRVRKLSVPELSAINELTIMPAATNRVSATSNLFISHATPNHVLYTLFAMLSFFSPCLKKQVSVF